ncbi:YfhO family protein [Patescibacteria group bacterium]|nr:YfhO family protein [Patescibacteria group bacterium]
MKEKIGDFLVIGVLILAILIFFQEPIYNGFVQSSAKILYSTDSLHINDSSAVENFTSNGLLGDTIYQFYPWHKFTLDSIKKFEIPFWNPYVLGGVPFFANYQSSLFEFTRLVSYLLSIPLNHFSFFSAFVELFFAGLFTFLFVRNLKVSRLGSIVSAISFMFSLPLVVWMQHPIGKVIIWLPLILLCIDKIIKRKFYYISILAFAIAFQFFAGNPEISFFVLLLGLSYAIFRTLNQEYNLKYSKIKILSILTIPFILGGLIALVQIIPFLELLSQSDMVGVGRTGSAGTNIFEAIFSGQWNTWNSSEGVKEFIKNISVAFNPNLYGSPVINSWWRETGNYSENSIYFGFLPFLFSLIAVMFSFKKKNVKFFLVVGISSLFISIAIPIFVLFNYLPIFNLVNLGRLRLVYVFCGAVLAGIGFDYVFNKENINKKKIIIIVLLFVLLLTFYSIVVFTLRSLMQVDLFKAQLIKNYLLIFSSIFILGISLFVVYKKGELKKSFRFNKHVIITMIFFDLFLYGSSYHPSLEEKYIYPQREGIAFLTQNTSNYERVTSLKFDNTKLQSSLIPNSSIVYNLYDARGFEVVKISRYEKLVEKDFNQIGEYFLGGNPPDRLLDVLGVKYIIQEKNSREDQNLADKKYKLSYSDDDINIYENSGYLPKVFFVENIINIKNIDDALNMFPKFNYTKEALVEIDDLEKIKSYNLKSQRENSESDVLEIKQYSPNYIEVQSSSENENFMVLSDTYYKNWHAYVDGEETIIYPVNVAFRGIFVPDGNHRIVFKYSPYRFNLLIIISIFTVFISVILFMKEIRPRKNK